VNSLALADGTAAIAAATVAGAWLAGHNPRHREIWAGAAAGALLVIAGYHLLPDAWAAALRAKMWPGTVFIAATASFALAWAAGRLGCACQEGRRHFDGAGAAAALAVHRSLEGSALALTASVTVAAALAVHSMGEGLAVGSLTRGRPFRQLATWLTVMCLAPLCGALITAAWHVPVAAGPVLRGITAGIVAQAAWSSLRSAFNHVPRSTALLNTAPVAAFSITAVITAVAVHAVG
jgi:zinc transporter ZupT